MNDENFQRYSKYYDLIYSDKDYVGEANYVANLLRAGKSRISSLLEFGSGTGRHGRILTQHGFRIKGIERSDVMLSIAKAISENDEFECQLGDIRSTRVEGLFDAVIALFHVISYLTRNEDIMAAFSNAARHLSAGGLFMFDVWHGPAVLTTRPSVRVKRVEDRQTRLTRIAEPTLDTNRNVVQVHYTMLAESKPDGKFVTFQEDHQMRYLFPVEIELLAMCNGFEVMRCEEVLTGSPPSESTWSLAYLLRKR